MVRPLKLSLVCTFYWIMYFTTYQRLTQIHIIQLYIPEHLRKELIEQYADYNGHLGIDGTHDATKRK